VKFKFFNYSINSLKELLVSSGFKAYNADQLFKWVYELNETDPEKMTNISKELRLFVKESFDFSPLQLITKQESQSGTNKFLFKLEDGIIIESVLMVHDYGLSLCVTSQAGCSMGCSFCASGLINKQRDLTTAELVNQIITVQNINSVKISHIVVMGTG